jgi:hypothetical protein
MSILYKTTYFENVPVRHQFRLSYCLYAYDVDVYACDEEQKVLRMV